MTISEHWTAHGWTSTVFNTFQLRHPELNISPVIVAGAETFDVVVERRLANRDAIANHACECAAAKALRRELAALDYVDWFVGEGETVYGLRRTAPDCAELVKYRHNGSGLVEAVDNGTEMTVDVALRVKPPVPSRAPGAQSRENRTRPDRKKRRPQSPETRARRSASITRTSRRFSEAARMVASGDAS